MSRNWNPGRSTWQTLQNHSKALVGLLALFLLGSPSARAQEGLSSFRKPVLMVETEGHHAPIRSLIWPDASTLLSAGLDKVVKQWDLKNEPTLVRSIRPPVWRGPAGIIYAINLSPWEVSKGKKLLAVAGYGVDATRGDFTIYPYPGPAEPAAGAPLARIMPPKDANAPGQRNTVLTLAFNPKFKSFATAGINGVVTLWNAETLQPFLVLKGHVDAVRALAYLPDGKRLVTIGEDRTLRLWNLDQGTELARYQGTSIFNALAISPDGLAIIAGTENGDLFQFDTANVRAPRFRLPTVPGQGPIECLAYRPDGKQLLSSVVASKVDLAVANDRAIQCDIELRDLPSGRVVWRRRLPGLIYAASFRPDGKAFAYSGGSDQAVHIQDVAALERAPVVLKGKGTTVYDIGFSADSKVVGFSRMAGPLAVNAEVDGFDLTTHRASRYPAASFRQALLDYNGWTLQGSINRYRLDAVQGGVVRWSCDLNPKLERLWWSYTFVPPGPGHPRPTLAVGCESGVVMYDLETGNRTRVFAGHSAAVVSLAVSPDGRWLASGSVDQTLMLYPLEGVDVRPPLGLTLAATPTGQVAIKAVAPGSFAALMGLLPGDVVAKTMIANGTTPVISTAANAMLAFPNEADALAPQTAQIGIWARRMEMVGPFAGMTFDLPPVPSSKRDNPALSLMLGVDREWVLWTPRGYYETSIEGDTRLLGWHVNAPYDQPKPNDFLPIVTFQGAMRRPRLLEDLWRLGDLDRAIAANIPVAPAVEPPPIAVAFDDQPPRIEFAALDPQVKPTGPGEPWTVSVPEARVRVSLIPQGESTVQGWDALVDQKRLVQNEAKGPKGATETDDLRFPLPPNQPVRLAVQATNARGVSRIESLDLIYIPPPPPVAPEPKPVPKEEPKPRAPRLEVVALGVDRAKAPSLPLIQFADADARDLGPFFAGHLFPTASKMPTRIPAEPLIVLNQGKGTTSQLREELEQLIGRAKDKQLLAGDSVAILLVAQGIETEAGLMLALADTEGKKTLAPLIPATEISEHLGTLATDYGCRVALFVDLIHGEAVESAETGEKFKAWIRDLQQNRQVITFVASTEGPSLDDQTARHGRFALGLLGAFEQVGANAGVRDRKADYSLLQFKTAVIERILEESGRRQQAGCFIPRSVSQKLKFASPLELPPAQVSDAQPGTDRGR